MQFALFAQEGSEGNQVVHHGLGCSDPGRQLVHLLAQFGRQVFSPVTFQHLQ
jgi:hypothetical protein